MLITVHSVLSAIIIVMIARHVYRSAHPALTLIISTYNADNVSFHA